jgi:hypothetical protein
MPTTVVERYGSLSATGFAKEAASAFGTPVAATTFVPMTGNSLELDPGLFSPKVMLGQRDVNTFPLYGQYKNAGSVTAPLFPTQGIALLAGAIGADAQAGNGVTGTGSASPNTLNGAVSAGATTVTLTSATGYTVGAYIQIDVNGSGPTTTAEVRKITVVSTNTLTLDTALVYAHANGAATKVVTAPFTHTITQANTLSSFTVEKDLGGAESLQFAGARIGKFGLQVQASNQEAAVSVDFVAKAAAVLATPTPITVTNESPYVFAEAVATIFSQAVTQVSQVDLTVENGLKETYTFNSSHNLNFLTPVTLKVSGKVDLVFTSLDDATWGYWTQMVGGTEGNLQLALTHPSSAGAVTIAQPRARIRTYGDSIKMDDVIMSSLQFDGYLNFSTLQTITATVANSAWLPY